jgi:hypothetical protein
LVENRDKREKFHPLALTGSWNFRPWAESHSRGEITGFGSGADRMVNQTKAKTKI